MTSLPEGLRQHTLRSFSFGHGLRRYLRLFGLPSLFWARSSTTRIRRIDPLTGLRTRDSFDALITKAIQSLNCQERRVGLFYIDLDHLKLINDAHGHAAGDAALRVVSQRLKKLENLKATPIRFGGDEFALLLENSSCKSIRRLLESLPSILSQPFEFDGRHLSPKVSIGAAAYPVHAKNAYDLHSRADAALYHAKKRGRNRACMFSQAMKATEERQNILHKKAQQAISENQIKIRYQPIVSTRDKTIHLVQSVPSWPKSVTSLTRGRTLEDLMDTRGFSTQLSTLLLSATLTKMKNCQSKSEMPVTFMARLPLPTLLADDFAETLLAKLKLEGVQPCYFALEIPSYILHRNEAGYLLHSLNTLTRQGIQLCITQYLSGTLRLEDFQNLNVSFVKVQSPVLQRLYSNKQTSSLVKAATVFAHSVGTKVILADVKGHHNLRELAGLNLDLIQGNAITPPMSIKELYEANLPRPTLPELNASLRHLSQSSSSMIRPLRAVN